MDVSSADKRHVLQADNIEAGYETDNPIVKDIRFHVGSGELVGLIGPNGAGKRRMENRFNRGWRAVFHGR